MTYTNLEKAQIGHNIWKYGMYVATSKRIFISILGVYYLTIPDVDIQQVGLIFLIANIASFLFEIPTGYISDRIGYKRMLIVAKAVMAVSTVIFIVASNFYLLVLAGVMHSLAIACFSGTQNAFIMESLKAIGQDMNYSKIVGKVSAYAMIFSLIFSALVPFLIKADITAPFYFALLLDLLGLAIALSFKDIKEDNIVKKEDDKKPKLSDVIKDSKALNFLPIALTSGFIFGTVNGLQIYRGPYQEFIGADLVMFGIYFALGRVLASAIMLKSDKIKECFSDIYSFERFQIIFFALAYLSLALIDNTQFIIFIFILINGIMWGVHSVRDHFFLDMISSSKYKATLLSIKGQYINLFTGVISISLGYIVSLYSYPVAFAVLTVYFVVVAALHYLYAVKAKNNNAKTK